MTTQDNWTFEEAYKKLPPDAQERVQAWLGTQMFIARELALPRERHVLEVAPTAAARPRPRARRRDPVR